MNKDSVVTKKEHSLSVRTKTLAIICIILLLSAALFWTIHHHDDPWDDEWVEVEETDQEKTDKPWEDEWEPVITEENELKSNREHFYKMLDDAVPDWRRINKHPFFLRWLGEKGHYGIIRQEMLDYYFNNLDADKVVELFKEFKNHKRRVDEWHGRK